MMIPPIAAEPIFHIGSFAVTNALVNAWIGVAFFLTIVALLSRRRAMVPVGLQNFAEWVVESMVTFGAQVTGSRARAEKLLPLAGTIFLFVLFSNWLGLIPGTGTIGIWQLHEGHVALIPLLRPAASDLNFTLAIAAISILATHIIGVFTIGLWKHANKFVNLRGIGKALKTPGVGPKLLAVFVALIEFMVGVIELFGEAAKTVSLSLRLFGNVFAGEVLLTVMAGLMAFFVPLPFMALELIVGLIQATVFAVLVLVFGSMLMEEPHGAAASH